MLCCNCLAVIVWDKAEGFFFFFLSYANWFRLTEVSSIVNIIVPLKAKDQMNKKKIQKIQELSYVILTSSLFDEADVMWWSPKLCHVRVRVTSQHACWSHYSFFYSIKIACGNLFVLQISFFILMLFQSNMQALKLCINT